MLTRIIATSTASTELSIRYFFRLESQPLELLIPDGPLAEEKSLTMLTRTSMHQEDFTSFTMESSPTGPTSRPSTSKESNSRAKLTLR